MKRIVLGLSGASGAPYAKRLIEVLRHSELARPLELSLVLSRTAETVWQHECGGSPRALGLPCYDGRDYAAPFASGSSAPDAMAIVPASMSCIARIAHGISDDLLTRAADVVLKERKPLVVVPREAPYSSIHLENMLALTRAGAVVVPASPSFYGRPQSLQDAIDSVLARVLDHLGLPNALSKRWGQDINLKGAIGAPAGTTAVSTVASAAADDEEASHG
jgi:4-hydroxy-3-polyprenylbenzoate decarboxylase